MAKMKGMQARRQKNILISMASWEKWQPVGESNPSFQVENLAS